MSPDDRRLHKLAGLANTVETAATALGGIVAILGVVMILAGSMTVEGGYSEPDVVYDLRSPGIMLVGFAVLFAPLAVLFARMCETWALHTATK